MAVPSAVQLRYSKSVTSQLFIGSVHGSAYCIFRYRPPVVSHVLNVNQKNKQTNKTVAFPRHGNSKCATVIAILLLVGPAQ